MNMMTVRLPSRQRNRREVVDNFIAAKFAQVTKGISQFFERDSTHELKSYVIYRWAYVAMEDVEEDGHTFFKIEVKDMNSGELALRLWEMKGDILISDQTFLDEYEKLGFSASWYFQTWQKLWGDRLDSTKNFSLKYAIREAVVKFKVKFRRYIVTNVYYRNRTLMDKLFIGLEYKIQGEYVDFEDKTHKYEWIVIGSKNLKAYQLVHTEHFELTDSQTKTSDLSLEEKTQIILFAREELIKATLNKDPGDWMAECCHLVRITPKKDGFVAFFYILQRFQNFTFGIVDIEVQKKGKYLYLLSYAKMGYSQESHNLILAKGTPIDALQNFNIKACVTTNDVIKNCLECARVHIKTLYEIINIEKVSARFLREKGKIRCIEYRLVVKFSHEESNVPREEWVIERDVEKESFKFIFSMKFLQDSNIRVLDSVNSSRAASRMSRSVESSRDQSMIRSFVMKGRGTHKERDLSNSSSFADLKNRSSVEFRPKVGKMQVNHSFLGSARKMSSSQKALFEIIKSNNA